jgi:CTP:molybdopterin cytidylyltransferase MocA
LTVCAVIPAAGRGSRLNRNGPKLLAPITEQETVWSLLRRRLEGLVDHIHVVLSPRDLHAFRRVLDHEAVLDTAGARRVTIGVQPQPTGMGDAVYIGHPVWSRADVLLVVWGDQVHVTRGTFQAALRLHANAQRRIVLPLVRLPVPYVEYAFDASGRLTAVWQSREGHRCQPGGLGDVGTFVLSTQGLGEEWLRFRADGNRGEMTGEINFLPFLLHLTRRHWETIPLHLSEPLQARGVNTPDDLEFFRNLYTTGVHGY